MDMGLEPNGLLIMCYINCILYCPWQRGPVTTLGRLLSPAIMQHIRAVMVIWRKSNDISGSNKDRIVSSIVQNPDIGMTWLGLEDDVNISMT